MILTTFKLGGRIIEVLQADTDMFSTMHDDVSGEDALIVEGLPLGKRWRKLGETVDEAGIKHYITEKIDAYRTIGLTLSNDREPFSEELLELINNHAGLVFQSPYKTEKKPYTRTRAYQLINGLSKHVGVHLYPHLLRSWRASQLARDYGWKEGKLMEWFDWKDFKSAHHYAKAGVFGLVSDMKRRG